MFAPNESQRIVNKNHVEPTKEELFQMLGKDPRRESKTFYAKKKVEGDGLEKVLSESIDEQ